MDAIDLGDGWRLETDGLGWALVQDVTHKRRDSEETYRAPVTRGHFGGLGPATVRRVAAHLGMAPGGVPALERIERAARAVERIAERVEQARRRARSAGGRE